MLIYETSDDRRREKQVLDDMCGVWMATYEQTPRKYTTDARIYRNGKLMFCTEVKCRKNKKSAYPDYIISRNKIVRALEISKLAGVPLVLTVKFTDGIYGTFVADDAVLPENCRVAGRIDRNDPNDKEMCCAIPMGRFLPLKNENKIRECLPGFEETNRTTD